MFTLQHIKDAHAKVRSGADFPAYVQALIQLGVARYSTFVADGHAEYQGTQGDVLISDAKYPALGVATASKSESFKNLLKKHQQGHSDYPTFCNDAARAGVEKWTVDMGALTCTYYDKAGTAMLVEAIPLPKDAA